MKKHAVLALVVMFVLLMSSVCFAETSFEGKVISVEKAVVSAPFGGKVANVTSRTGDRIAVGDRVLEIRPTLVYSPVSGKVSGIFATPGESAEDIAERYGAVMYIEPDNRYTVSASTVKSYNASENKLVCIGEEVYVSCTQDGTHAGRGIVTKVEGSDESGNCKYALEITSGEFYMGETVAIYRDAALTAASCIGRGTIMKNAAIPVKAGGSVLRIDVSKGERVERGQKLFETVEGGLDGLFASDCVIVSDVAGIVSEVSAEPGASVTKGGTLITVYPMDSLRVQIGIPERELADIAIGDTVRIEFDWDMESEHISAGTVESISYLSEGEDTQTASTYSALVSFEPDETVRLGMTSMVYIVSAPDEDAE